MLLLDLPIVLNATALSDFGTRHHIARLALFGSILRADFTPESDVDILVDFESEHVPGLIRLMTMQYELEVIIARAVDLVTPNSLHILIRDRVLAQSQVIYERT